LWLGAGTAAGALLLGRTCFYDVDSAEPWEGKVLAEWEAVVLGAAAGALILDEPGELSAARGGQPSGVEVARRVDGFLQGLPAPMLLQIHAMFGLVEHGTILNGSIRRFSRLSPEARLAYLTRLNEMGSKFAEAFRGLRDLCLLGFYANRRAWGALGYDGPLLERPAPAPIPTRSGAANTSAGKYARLLAKPGQKPEGAL
jgi:hypothetical protein